MKLIHLSSLSFLLFGSGCGLLGGALGGAVGGPKPYGPYKLETRAPLVSFGSTTGGRELRIQTSITVAPDRGFIPLYVVARGSNYDEAASETKKGLELIKKLGSASGCGFKIDDYTVPIGAGKAWTAGAHAEIYAEVTGLDPDARIARADACFKPLREFLYTQKEDTKAPSSFAIVPPILPPFEFWNVEVLDKHRDALLTQANDRFKAVQKTDAKMWDHADVQCTSDGVVTVAEAFSHAIVLQLEMYCPVAGPETGSGPGRGREIPK